MCSLSEVHLLLHLTNTRAALKSALVWHITTHLVRKGQKECSCSKGVMGLVHLVVIPEDAYKTVQMLPAGSGFWDDETKCACQKAGNERKGGSVHAEDLSEGLKHVKVLHLASVTW